MDKKKRELQGGLMLAIAFALLTFVFPASENKVNIPGLDWIFEHIYIIIGLCIATYSIIRYKSSK